MACLMYINLVVLPDLNCLALTPTTIKSQNFLSLFFNLQLYSFNMLETFVKEIDNKIGNSCFLTLLLRLITIASLLTFIIKTSTGLYYDVGRHTPHAGKVMSKIQDQCFVRFNS